MKTKTIIAACAIAALASCADRNGCANRCGGQCAPADSMNVVLDLHRKIKPGKVAAFKASFARCKQSTLKEPGCMDYGVYQSPEDSTEFLIHEVWLNQAELDKHGQTPHLQAHVAETKDMCESKSDRRFVVCPRVQPQ